MLTVKRRSPLWYGYHQKVSSKHIIEDTLRIHSRHNKSNHAINRYHQRQSASGIIKIWKPILSCFTLVSNESCTENVTGRSQRNHKLLQLLRLLQKLFSFLKKKWEQTVIYLLSSPASLQPASYLHAFTHYSGVYIMTKMMKKCRLLVFQNKRSEDEVIRK